MNVWHALADQVLQRRRKRRAARDPEPRPAFCGEHDIEASSIRAGCPDLWFNGTPVGASDIACLDVDAFDEFFDLVVDQREEARAAAAPAAHA